MNLNFCCIVRYFTGDQDKLFEEAHVVNPLTLKDNSSHKVCLQFDYMTYRHFLI